MFIVTEYAALMHQLQKVLCFRRLRICREASLTNCVDPDQTAPASSLIWGPHCLPLALTNKHTFLLAFYG